MKNQALTAFQTARILFDQARILGLARTGYSASASLVVLQDAMELVLLGSLVEIGADEEINLESLSFDQMIGELRRRNVPVPKSGTLKAMNKQRVIVKHYGQLSDAIAVSAYEEACYLAADVVLAHIAGKKLSEIHLSELLEDSPSRGLMDDAIRNLEKGEYWLSLVDVRKAIFLEIEVDFTIDGYREKKTPDIFEIGFRGYSAPWHVKSPEWIKNNVKSVFEYVQIDRDKIKVDLLEWGVNTEDCWNISRLTPRVYQPHESAIWVVDKNVKHIYVAATEDNAKYCVNAAINLLAAKSRHSRSFRSVAHYSGLEVRIDNATVLFDRADIGADALDKLEPGRVLGADSIVTGFDLVTDFVRIMHLEKEPFKFVSGYVRLADCSFVSADNTQNPIPAEEAVPSLSSGS